MAAVLSVALAFGGCATRGSVAPQVAEPASGSTRIALFNIRELSTEMLRNVDAEGSGRDPQVRAAAAVVQAVRPDILVLNEIDHDYGAEPFDPAINGVRFAEHYLARGESPLRYPFVYAAPCNTGILSGIDLDGNGRTATPADERGRDFGNDCWGFGNYPGQYSMAVLSRVPLRAEEARGFRLLKWQDLPGNHMEGAGLSTQAAAAFRLSSKSHWDIPVDLGGRTVHLLVSHPTPQGFDGAEDRNGRRNFDEIRFWKLYLDGVAFPDDGGATAPLPEDAEFVVIGDLNAAPGDGSRYDGMHAIDQLLKHPRVNDITAMQTSEGALLRGAVPGPPRFAETATFGSGNGPRIDHTLPSRGLEVTGGGVYWPGDALWGTMLAEFASDHRLLWVDLRAE